MKNTVKIYFSDTQKKIPVTKELRALVRKAIRTALRFEDFQRSCEVSVTFADDEEIRRLNARYRGVDRATDVLSFPMAEGEPEIVGAPLALGDIVLDLERAAAQGEAYGHGFERETAFLVVHSMLHLLGYDHETGEEDEREMRTRQSAIVALCGYPVNDSEIKGAEDE